MTQNPIDIKHLFTKLNAENAEMQLVCHLGPTAFLAMDVFPEGMVLPLYGSMGMVLPVSLGLAMGSNSKIIAIEGDGGLLMNLGAVATVASISPSNMLCIILDNGGYNTTGGQPTAFSATQGISNILSAAGFQNLMTASQDNIDDAITWGLKPGLRAIVCKTAPLIYPFRDRRVYPADSVVAFSRRQHLRF
ncbi:thiamine pyrophosphate-dependent enzyme [Rothia sp. P7208]|uniref:thiamine pyrophosphate-dependent enzyme n=1 Tax=Rothia sp. P7208 TaxID=3402660 RepID=UPI003AD12BB4